VAGAGFQVAAGATATKAAKNWDWSARSPQNAVDEPEMPSAIESIAPSQEFIFASRMWSGWPS
jgi:hypothetical protein